MRTWAFSFKVKYLKLYSMLSKRLYCFRHRGGSGMVACLVHISALCYLSMQEKARLVPPTGNNHAPYSSEFYGDVLQERIT